MRKYSPCSRACAMNEVVSSCQSASGLAASRRMAPSASNPSVNRTFASVRLSRTGSSPRSAAAARIAGVASFTSK